MLAGFKHCRTNKVSCKLKFSNYLATSFIVHFSAMSIRPSASLAKTRVLRGQVYRYPTHFINYYNYYCCCCCCYFCWPLFIPLLCHRNNSIEKFQNREIQIILRSFLFKFIQFVWIRHAGPLAPISWSVRILKSHKS